MRSEFKPDKRGRKKKEGKGKPNQNVCCAPGLERGNRKQGSNSLLGSSNAAELRKVPGLCPSHSGGWPIDAVIAFLGNLICFIGPWMQYLLMNITQQVLHGLL